MSILFKKEIQAVVEKCCVANGCPDLADKIDVEWDSRRFAKNPGTARIGTMTVVLSDRVMSTLSASAQAEAVSRETCSLIAWHLRNSTKRDGLWETLMEKAGYPNAKARLKAFEKTLKEKQCRDTRASK